MDSVRKFIFAILLFTFSFSLCGCWNYKEIDRMFVVMGTVVDKNDKNGNYVLSIETLTPKGAKETKMVTQVISAEGITIHDAIRNAILKSGRKMYWGHSIVWVISKKVAEEGIVPVIDMINRSKEIRPDILVAVSNNLPPDEMFYKSDQINDCVSRHLYEMFREKESAGKYREIPLWKTINEISDPSVSLILPLIETARNPKEFQVDNVKSAIFKNEKMIGVINEIETRSTLILRNELKNMFVLALSNTTNNELSGSTIEVASSHTKIKINTNDDKLYLNIDISVKGNITELQSKINYFTKTNRHILEKEYEDLLKEQMKSVILKAQKDLKVDIFGFGKEVRIQKPSFWKKIEPNWDEYFKNLECNIEAKVKITGSSLKMKPI